MRYNFIQAVEHIRENIHKNVYSFYLDTEFGSIVVRDVTEDYDHMHPVEVVNFADCYDDRVIVDWKDKKPDYYITIGNTLTTFSTMFHAVEAMVMVMFLSSINIIPDEDLVDAAVLAYIESEYKAIYGTRTMTKQFLKVNCDLLIRGNDTLKMVVQELINMRSRYAKRALENAREMVRGRTISPIFMANFRNKFFMDFLGLIMVAISRNTELQDKFDAQNFKDIVVA